MAVCSSSVSQAVAILRSRAHLNDLRQRCAAWRRWSARRQHQRALVASHLFKQCAGGGCLPSLCDAAAGLAVEVCLVAWAQHSLSCGQPQGKQLRLDGCAGGALQQWRAGVAWQRNKAAQVSAAQAFTAVFWSRQVRAG